MIYTREQLLTKKMEVLRRKGMSTRENEARLAELTAAGNGGLLSGAAQPLQTVE